MNPPRAFLLLLFLSTAMGTLVNVTIDDTLGDLKTGAQVTYLPSGGWKSGTTCQTCPVSSQLVANETLEGTFSLLAHDIFSVLIP